MPSRILTGASERFGATVGIVVFDVGKCHAHSNKRPQLVGHEDVQKTEHERLGEFEMSYLGQVHRRIYYLELVVRYGRKRHHRKHAARRYLLD